MDIRKIERILLDQQEELDNLRAESFCRRLQENAIDLQSNLVQVVIGVRRSGKSTLCFNALEHSGVRYAYVNFDDERFEKIALSDLDTVLESLYKIYGNFTHLFMDEIQNVNGWHLFANRMLRKKIRLILTGSNSKLLSGELASHLTGRHHSIELLPFSFADFCSCKNIATTPLSTKNRGLIAAAYDEYLKQGGFPELMTERDTKSYIDSLVNNIITQDIQKRFKIRHIDTLLRLTHHLLNESPVLIVKEKLQALFDFKSSHTLGNYLSYLKQTYLISTVSKYSAKSRLRMRNEKCYAIDAAFMNNRSESFSGENIGWRMETIVYLELRRRTRSVQQDIYYYEEAGAEADFVVCDGARTLAVYQVSYSLQNPKTRKREIRGAIAAARGTHCRDIHIITDHETEEITTPEGFQIHVIPIWEWLLQSSSL